MKKTLINIIGAERTGSTLLDVMLGHGENCFSCGEVAFFFRPTRKHHFRIDCSCGRDQCPVWNNLKDSTERELHNTLLQEYEYIIDSSKLLTWVVDTSEYLENKYRIVNLLTWKKPENAAFSFWKRKYDIDKSMKDYIGYYHKVVEMGLPFLSVNYERLVESPSDTIKNICDKMNMNYFQGKENFWKESSHHFLFGSDGIRQQIRMNKAKLYKKEVKPKDFTIYIKDNRVYDIKLVEGLIKKIKARDIFKTNIDYGLFVYESKYKTPWYYYRKVGRKIKSYFPEDYQILNVNPLYSDSNEHKESK